jgi:GGDEF domain-containing protein
MGSFELLAWGAYIGVAGLLLVGALSLYVIADARAGLEFALSVIVSTAYVMVNLGWVIPDDPATAERLLATVGLGSAAFLGSLLTRLLRVEHSERRLKLSAYVLVVAGSIGLLVSPALDSHSALWLATVMVALCGVMGALVCLLAQWYGDRLAGLVSVACLCVAFAGGGLGWLALHRGESMPVLHGFCALAASAYLALLATASWMRYQYKLEMRLAMRDRQTYDPLTRMSSSTGPAKLLNAAIKHAKQTGSPIGVISITISNLRALEALHGAEFANRALYALAWRLRSSSTGAEVVGRIGDDAFLIIAGRLTDSRRFAKRGPRLVDELNRPISLGVATLSGGATMVEWQAETGVGVLWVDQEHLDTGRVLSMARSLAVSALSFNSRVARFDASRSNIVEFASSSRQ